MPGHVRRLQSTPARPSAHVHRPSAPHAPWPLHPFGQDRSLKQLLILLQGVIRGVKEMHDLGMAHGDLAKNKDEKDE